ncbi:MAG: rod shape-determining protein RodA, partial [Candidatus Omnitrophota bacterium]
RLIIIAAALLICAIGVMCIYSSTYQKEGRLWQDIYKRQIIWMALGIVFFFLLSNFNYRKLWDATYPLYAFVIFLLFLVFVLGLTRMGAQRWLRLFWFNFQPSEFAKLVMVIFLARYYSTKSAFDVGFSAGRLNLFKGLVLPLVLVMFPVGLIIEQPDLGSGVMVMLIFMAVVFISGVKLRYIGSFLGLGLACIPVLWHYLRGYQKERLMVFLNPNIDPLGAGYTVIQSKIAIGSGGIIGKGWLSGTQGQLRFLPEAHTDFIFATFAEEWGLLGCGVLLFLYYLIISEGIRIGMRTNDAFAKLLAFGISMMLGIQVLVNIAMNLGLAPVVGVPLLLMSYGGSSVFVTFIALGILANMDKQRSMF